MKGYAALSRVVREADGLLVAQPFSPLLFKIGAQPWPSLLFDVQRGRALLGDLDDRCEQAARASKATKLLKQEDRQRCARKGGVTKPRADLSVSTRKGTEIRIGT